MKKKISSAADLLRKHGIKEAPVDVRQICRNEGIKVTSVDFEDLEKEYGDKPISGVLLVDGDGKDIFVNEEDTALRKNFTIAHELGHYFLHHDYDSSESMTVSFRRDKTVKEYEADNFAAELLMPKDFVEAEYKKLDIPFIFVLANEFNVSKAAMMYRLDNLNKRYVRI